MILTVNAGKIITLVGCTANLKFSFKGVSVTKINFYFFAVYFYIHTLLYPRKRLEAFDNLV